MYQLRFSVSCRTERTVSDERCHVRICGLVEKHKCRSLLSFSSFSVVVISSDSLVLTGRMIVTDELEWLWKEALWHNLRHYPRNWLEGLKEAISTSLRETSLLVEIRAGYIPNTNQKLYRLNHFALWETQRKMTRDGVRQRRFSEMFTVLLLATGDL
jgi:hypothetical protein